MPITFTCRCNRELVVPDGDAGRTARCPGCGHALHVPGQALPSASPADLSRESQVVTPRVVARPFGAELADALRYPFTFKGIALLLGGGFVLAFFDTGNMSPWSILGCITSAVYMVASAYVAACFLKIVESSARGDRELPRWPDFTDMWDDFVRPALLVGAAALVAYGPLIALWFCRDRPGFPAWLTGAAPTLVLEAVGSVYFVVAVLGAGALQSVVAVSPHVVLPAAARVFVPAVVAAGVMWLALFGYGHARVWLVDAFRGMTFPPALLLGVFLIKVVMLYGVCVVGRLIGRVHWTHREKLGWFRHF
jgi:hypothetical protein